MDTSGDSVEVAIEGQDAFVRVSGRGTFKVGPALKQFGMMAIERGSRRIIVDMRDCVGMDSTFMGILAGLAGVLKKTEGEVVLRRLSEKNLFLVKMLGLLHLLRVDEASHEETVSGASTHALAAGGDKQAMTQAMIAAHEALVEAAPDNIVKFKDVLAYLKEDLKRATPPLTGAVPTTAT